MTKRTGQAYNVRFYMLRSYGHPFFDLIGSGQLDYGDILGSNILSHYLWLCRAAKGTGVWGRGSQSQSLLRVCRITHKR
jgi:hypothetical protein